MYGKCSKCEKPANCELNGRPYCDGCVGAGLTDLDDQAVLNMRFYAHALLGVTKQLVAMQENLTSTQARCTELLEDRRAATTFILGNDKSGVLYVLVARQYKVSGDSRTKEVVHDWGVFVCDDRKGPYIRGDAKGDGVRLAEKSRQFDDQQSALVYARSLLKELRGESQGEAEQADRKVDPVPPHP